MKKTFDDIVNNLRYTIADYKFYTDFEKVYKNIEKYKIELNILNSLIGSDNIEKDFLDIITKYPEVIKVIPLLIAKREYEVPIIDDNKLIKFNFEKRMSNDNYLIFMEKTGIFNLLKERKIKSLIDYMAGIEVGLDSNARKNRTGDKMENIVEEFIKNTNYIEYHKQMNKFDIYKKYKINLNEFSVSNKKGKNADKKFDFVIKTKDNLYLIEVNFYNSGGSKLNETSRSFKELGQTIDKLSNIYFIWITDGEGWKTARNNLEETYREIDHLYTLADLEDGVLNNLIK